MLHNDLPSWTVCVLFSLRNIVGPLGLTMTDVTTHLNSLVRTFRLVPLTPRTHPHYDKHRATDAS